MDTFNKNVIIGIVTVVLVIVVLFAILSGMQNTGTGPKLEREEIDMCRNLTRQGADILVQVAQSNLKPDNLDDAQQLSAFESRVSEIEHELDVLNCSQTQDQWAYGSFRQEMLEYEAYIADLVRQNKEK